MLTGAWKYCVSLLRLLRSGQISSELVRDRRGLATTSGMEHARRNLFGGAMWSVFADRFADVSGLRPVPDNQEVFQAPLFLAMLCKHQEG
ncbi:MAG: hypothetical protein EOP49_34465 [Sphingobacteriales bacterium]|nr:MAG: hypothetical protein EOP49_34465 [Sphingobacteriales bacterium]